MKNEVSNKEKLIEMLSFIRDTESEKPSDEMDNDLIADCTELLLDLQNKNVTLSTEEIEERVKNIPFTENTKTKVVEIKRKTTVRKLLIIAAVISLLFTILTFSTTGSEWNMFDALYKKYDRMTDVPTNVVFFEEGTSYWVEGPAKTYDSFDEWAQNENTDILLPKKFPDCFTFYGILVGPDGDYEETIFSFNNGMTSYAVTHDAPIPQGVLDNVTPITIGNTEVYIEDLYNVNHYQVYFSYNGDCYCIIHSEKEPVHEILKDLEPYL